jgi:hypothetical protein
MHGNDDQVVLCRDAALLSAKLLKHGTLKVYSGFRTACSPPTPTSSTWTSWVSSAVFGGGAAMEDR